MFIWTKWTVVAPKMVSTGFVCVVEVASAVVWVIIGLVWMPIDVNESVTLDTACVWHETLEVGLFWVELDVVAVTGGSV